MSTTLNDTMNTAKSMMGSAKEGTEHAVASARSTLLDGIHTTEHAAASARSSLFDGIRTAASVYATIRGLGLTDALGWVGLSRRRSPLTSIATFGAGVVVGAGVGMLFAPMSGADTRKSILGRFQGLEKEAEKTIKKVEAGAKDLEGKAEDLAGKAKDTVVNTEQKVEKKVTEGLEAAKDAVKTKADSAVSAAKDAVEDVKSAVGAGDQRQAARPGDTAKPATDAGNHRSTARQ